MKKEGFLGDILDLILEPENKRTNKPKHQEVKVWMVGNPRNGVQPHWLKQKLKMKNKNTAIIEYKGVKIKLLVRTEFIQQGKNRNVNADVFTSISASGVDVDVNTVMLKEMVFNALKEAGVRSNEVLRKQPRGKEY
jgi:hypothetical protein